MRLLAHRSAARLQLELARRSPRRRAVVLLYHGVGPATGDPTAELLPALGESVFRDQLAHLAKHYDVVPAEEVHSRLNERCAGAAVPVAITFDDDLAAHLRHAAPALAERGMPAAFFLTGRTLEGSSPFWWQDLQALADRGPSALHATRERLASRWPWAAGSGAVHDLARTIENLPPPERDAVAGELRELAGEGTQESGLSAKDVSVLAAGGFEIGFHTRRHDPLPLLGDDQLADAMDDGRPALEAAVGRPLTSIAYPHGRADLRVAEAARRAGYTAGFAWRGGAIGERSAPLLLDRVGTWAPSVEVFASRLAWAVARGG